MPKGLPKPWNIQCPPQCTTAQSMQFYLRPPSSCPRHSNPDSSFQVTTPYHRIDGYGPPSEDIGHIDDIYVDLTAGSQMMYARGLSSWVRWTGLSCDDELGYIEHSSVKERYLWCSTKGISWFPWDIVRGDPAKSLGVGDSDAICQALRGEFEKQRKKKEKTKRAGSEGVDERLHKRQKSSLDGVGDAVTQNNGSGKDSDLDLLVEENRHLIEQNEQLEQNCHDQLHQIEELKADVRSLTAAAVATTSKTSTRDYRLPVLAAPDEDVKPQALSPSGPMVIDEDLSKEDYDKYSSMNINTLINLARQGDFVTELNHRVILAEARTRSLVAERDEARLMSSFANQELAEIKSNLQRISGV